MQPRRAFRPHTDVVEQVGPDEVEVGHTRPHAFAAYVVGGVALVALLAAGVLVALTRDEPPAPAAAEPGTGYTLQVYTVAGHRLYVEARHVAGDPTRVQALDQALLQLTRTPQPGHQTLWGDGAFGGVRVAGDRIEVTVRRGASAEPDLAVQQVVYTLQAAVGRPLPVRFRFQRPARPRTLGVDAATAYVRDASVLGVDRAP
jgi:hypothetical protein